MMNPWVGRALKIVVSHLVFTSHLKPVRFSCSGESEAIFEDIFTQFLFHILNFIFAWVYHQNIGARFIGYFSIHLCSRYQLLSSKYCSSSLSLYSSSCTITGSLSMGSGREPIVDAEFISLHPQKGGQHCDSIECVALLEVLACSIRK